MEGKEAVECRWMEEGGYLSNMWRQTHWGKDLWWTACPVLQGQVGVEGGGWWVCALGEGWVMSRARWVWGGWGGDVTRQVGRLIQSRSTSNTCFSLLYLARLRADSMTLPHTEILILTEGAPTCVNMNTPIDTNGINIHHYHAVGLKCLYGFLYVTLTNTYMQPAPAFVRPINHAEREESWGQWSVS